MDKTLIETIPKVNAVKSPEEYEQVAALGANGVALVETLKVIGEKNVRITPDIMASGGNGNGDGGGGIGTLLLLNLFREQMQKNVDKPAIASTNGTNGTK